MMEAEIGHTPKGYYIGRRDSRKECADYLWPDGEWHKSTSDGGSNYPGYYPTRKAAQKMLDMQKLVRECTLKEFVAFLDERKGWATLRLGNRACNSLNVNNFNFGDYYGDNARLSDIDRQFPIPNKALEEAKAVAKAAVDEYVRQGGKREDV